VKSVPKRCAIRSDREWQTTLARAYKMLAEAISDAEPQFDSRARQRTGQIIGRTLRSPRC
jgi:hypothetical protein